jgi:homoserine kinase type II
MAVYTRVSEEALAGFLAEYDLGDLVALRGIAEGVENSNYALTTSAGRHILTLYEKRVDPGELPWFLGLMAHLAEHGIACPHPVPGRDGSMLRMLCGRPACITTFLPGGAVEAGTSAQLAALGRMLARMHAAGLSYTPTRRNTLGVQAWAPLLEQCRVHAAELPEGLIPELDAAHAAVLAGWPQALPQGQIHADLFPDNVFFGADPTRDMSDATQDVSGVIDFYFAATDLLAYDLAICINAWCFDADLRFRPDLVRALLAAYSVARPLTPAEAAALPVLCQGAALRFLLTRLYDWVHTPPDAIVVKKDPFAYLARLRFFLTQPDALHAL